MTRELAKAKVNKLNTTTWKSYFNIHLTRINHKYILEVAQRFDKCSKTILIGNKLEMKPGVNKMQRRTVWKSNQC